MIFSSLIFELIDVDLPVRNTTLHLEQQVLATPPIPLVPRVVGGVSFAGGVFPQKPSLMVFFCRAFWATVLVSNN